MAKTDTRDNASWPFAEELLDRGDPAFVGELRRLTDADRLGAFAARWYDDRRPASRRLLFAYLDLPLNAFRHEALVKRLFKLAQRAEDDEVMARFLVLFDRSERRIVRPVKRRQTIVPESKEVALALARRWREQGYFVWFNHAGGRASFGDQLPAIDSVTRTWTEEDLVCPPGTTMWRPGPGLRKPGPHPLDDKVRKLWEEGHRLFSLPTRRYLRRRAWRYFRLLGKRCPERYVPALVSALKCYRDEDVIDGAALLDNWGLVHALFHHSPVLQSSAKGWAVAPDRSLKELSPAPLYEPLWLAAPLALLDLVREARSRPVRQWALHLIRRNHATILRDLPPEELLSWLGHADPAVVAAAVEVLGDLPDLTALGVDRLLRLLDEPNPETMEVLCGFLASRLPAERVPFTQALRLAGQRPVPVARLGFTWLQGKPPASADERQALLALVEAQAVPLRPDMMRWLRGVLGPAPDFSAEWVLELLDSRHADVRAEGWQWLVDEPRVAEDFTIWHKLLESPYDDVRLHLVAVLEQLLADHPARAFEQTLLAPELLQLMWATVLLNIHRGGRSKPAVVSQVVRRLVRCPEEARELLPLLAVALRSVRGPEWRAGLAGLVQAVQQRPGLRPLIERAFPELKFGP